MLELEPVSQYRKSNNNKKVKVGTQTEFYSSKSLNFEEYSLSEIIESYRQKIQYSHCYEKRQFEDSHLTRFIHDKKMLIRWSMNNFAMTSILLSLIGSFFHVESLEQQLILALHSAITFALIVLVFLKHKISVTLKQKQLIRTKKQNQIIKCIRSVAIEVVFLGLHPSFFGKGWIIQIQEPVYGGFLPLNVNTLLEIFMLCRIYLLFLALIGSSKYCSTRANRICRIYSTKNEDLFGLKSVFNAYPLLTLVTIFSTMLVVFSQMLKLSQETNSQFSDYGNAIWCVIITMGTIGYGDYAPTTYLGRVVAFLAAISGIIMASLLILTLSRYLTMSTGENKSHITIKRLQMRELLEKYAEETVLQTTWMADIGDGESAKAIEELKKKTERVKLTIRRIKNTVDSQNVNEEINRLFETLQQSLMEIYLQQDLYSKNLQALYLKEKSTIQATRFTFTHQIENIIRDR